MTTEGSFAALDKTLMLSSDRAVSQQPSSSRPQCRFKMCVPVKVANTQHCVINSLQTCFSESHVTIVINNIKHTSYF